MAYIDKGRIQSHLRLKCLAKYPDTFINGLLAAANEIGEMPTADVVEVVRCKDCEHYHHSGYCTQIGMSKDRFMNDFCSYGRRKNNGEN